MKPALIRILIGILLLCLGFAAGRIFQHGKTGYYFEVRQKKLYPFQLGNIEWSNVTESVGLPFLDPGTTILEYDGRIIYKAKRWFQEDHPFAENIMTADNSVDWNDGDYRFHLTINKLVEKKEPAKP